MTLDEMCKQYIREAVEEYMSTRDNTNDTSTEQINNLISEYLSDNDYMTRDDVSDQINGATVYIEASLSA
jgi:hypothetical protein